VGMKANIIRIGNSRGIRIPKILLQETHLPDEVELEARGAQIVIRPAERPRDGWEERFSAMAAAGDDTLLVADGRPLSSWDKEEWEW
jgi:antitoxin MazE